VTELKENKNKNKNKCYNATESIEKDLCRDSFLMSENEPIETDEDLVFSIKQTCVTCSEGMGALSRLCHR
jgi:hypothetical protein